jgi:uncharacterized protein
MNHKTAADLTPTEILHFREALKSRQVSTGIQNRTRVEKARQVADLAAALLKTEFSAVRVVLFGSVIHTEHFHRRSDIDLAVWGIKEREYFRAVGILQSLDPAFSIDLIIFDEANSNLQKIILSEGVEL